MTIKQKMVDLAQYAVGKTQFRLVTGQLADPELLQEVFADWSQGVLHFGGHVGQEAENYAEFNKPVVWFEAIPSIAEKLRTHVAQFPHQRVIEACISNVDGERVTFNISSNDQGASSSLFEFGTASSGPQSMWPDLNLRMVDTIELETSTIDSLLAANNVDARQYDHWIVDLQGAELLALQGAQKSLEYCRSLVVESSSIDVYSGGAQWTEIRDFLTARGFVPLWECLGHFNVLFVRLSTAQ